MPLNYVALLRAISNVPMLPMRRALQELGLQQVASYGMSGNLLFNAPGRRVAELEQAISARLGALALVRTRADMERIAARHPYRGQAGAAFLFLRTPVPTAQLRALAALAFAAEPPVICGRTVYLVYPLVLRGKRATFDLERFLGVLGTMRSAGAVNGILQRMHADRGEPISRLTAGHHRTPAIL